LFWLLILIIFTFCYFCQLVLDPAFPQSYHQKLSNAIIQASEQKEGTRYSKQLHTARFIKQLDSEVAKQKCPEFRKFFSSLTRLTQKVKT
jgi:hypothetical protein